MDIEKLNGENEQKMDESQKNKEIYPEVAVTGGNEQKTEGKKCQKI